MASKQMSQERAYMQAFEDYADVLFRHCFFRISDRERAKDLVQDTFMKTWNYIQQGNEVKEFRSFLYRTANNLIIDEYRKKKTVSLEDVPDGEIDEVHHIDEREKLESQFDAERVVAVLHRLPEPYRRVITMRYVEGLSPKEIALLIDEKEKTVSVRIHRGILHLRKILAYE